MNLLDNFRYIGEFRHTIDSKRRLTIPARWRFPGDEAEVYLALPNPEGFISVYPPAKVAQIQEKVSQISMGDKEGQKLLMYLSSMAHSFGCDKQGRIHLNEQLIQHAGIEKESIFLGNFTTFSIWSPKLYATSQKQVHNAKNFAQTLVKFGL